MNSILAVMKRVPTWMRIFIFCFLFYFIAKAFGKH